MKREAHVVYSTYKFQEITRKLEEFCKSPCKTNCKKNICNVSGTSRKIQKGQISDSFNVLVRYEICSRKVLT
jgi:hypothetical protein